MSFASARHQKRIPPGNCGLRVAREPPETLRFESITSGVLLWSLKDNPSNGRWQQTHILCTGKMPRCAPAYEAQTNYPFVILSVARNLAPRVLSWDWERNQTEISSAGYPLGACALCVSAVR